MNVDEELIKRYVRALDGRLTVPAEEATASLAGLRPVIHAGKPGIALSLPKTRQRIEGALAVAYRPVLRPVAKTVAPTVTRSNFGAVVVIYRGSNVLPPVSAATKPWRTIPGCDRAGDLPDADRVRSPSWTSSATLGGARPNSEVGKGLEAGPARPRESARHALDGDLGPRRRDARHPGRGLDRLLGLARLHPHAGSRTRSGSSTTSASGTPVFIVNA